MLCTSLLFVSPALLVTQAHAQTPTALIIDFDAGMNGLNFDPKTVDANLDAAGKGNGMLDADEMALVSALLANPAMNLTKSGGVNASDVRQTFRTGKVVRPDVDLKSLSPATPRPRTLSPATSYWAGLLRCLQRQATAGLALR